MSAQRTGRTEGTASAVPFLPMKSATRVNAAPVGTGVERGPSANWDEDIRAKCILLPIESWYLVWVLPQHSEVPHIMVT